MRIYALTSMGKKLARSVTNPDSPGYKVIAHLDQSGHATIEQIAAFCGMSEKEASSVIRKLKRHRVITEVSGSSV